MRLFSALVALTVFLPSAAFADQVNLAFGGDSYAAGQTTAITEPVARDAFAAGYSVTLGAPVDGSAHLAGYNVNASAAIGGDLYAAGFAVTVTGAVAGDVTAAGNSVILNGAMPVTGNGRLAGSNVVVDTGIGGSLLATAAVMSLNAPVAGDFSFYGDTLTFGPNARVDGKVSIHAPKEIAVPTSVAAADRVTFQQITTPDYTGEMGRTAETVVRGVWFAVWATIIWWLLLFVVGALFIAAAPKLIADLTALSMKRPFGRLGIGVLSFSATIGLVLVALLTVIGIFLLPFVALYVFAACSLAYLAGVYFVGLRIWSAFAPSGTNVQRMIVLALSLIVGGLVTMVPFIGWLATLLLLAFGFGVVSVRVIASWNRGEDALRAPAPGGA